MSTPTSRTGASNTSASGGSRNEFSKTSARAVENRTAIAMIGMRNSGEFELVFGGMQASSLPFI